MSDTEASGGALVALAQVLPEQAAQQAQKHLQRPHTGVWALQDLTPGGALSAQTRHQTQESKGFFDLLHGSPRPAFFNLPGSLGQRRGPGCAGWR